MRGTGGALHRALIPTGNVARGSSQSGVAASLWCAAGPCGQDRDRTADGRIFKSRTAQKALIERFQNNKWRPCRMHRRHFRGRRVASISQPRTTRRNRVVLRVQLIRRQCCQNALRFARPFLTTDRKLRKSCRSASSPHSCEKPQSTCVERRCPYPSGHAYR